MFNVHPSRAYLFRVHLFRVHLSKVHLRLSLLLLLLPIGLLLALSGAQPAGAASATATPRPPRPAATVTPSVTPSVTAAKPLTSTGATTTTQAATVVTAATALTATVTAPVALDARAAAGREVYLKNYCGICHTLAAAGTNGTFGPSHNGIATAAKQRIADPSYGGKAVTVVQYLRESIVEPTLFAAPGYAYTSHPMPSYAHLPKRDLDALIYFLLQQK